MQACPNCKHFQAQLHFDERTGMLLTDPTTGFGKVTRACHNGHQDACDSWWDANGAKTPDQVVEELPCYEPGRIAQMVSSLRAKVQLLHETRCSSPNTSNQ